MLVFEAVVRLTETITLGFLIIGGFKLRGLRPSGPRLLRGTFWARITLLAVAMVAGWILAVRTDAEGVNSISTFEIIEATVGFIAVGFEIAALVWLRRNRPALDALCRQVAAGVGPRGTIAVMPPGNGSATLSRSAIWGAILAGLSLVLVGGPLMLAVVGGVGLGFLEVLLVGLPGCLCGIAGTVLGWIALSQIRAGQGRVSGLPLALFAALACPALALLGVTVAVPMFTLVSENFGRPPIMARIVVLLIPAGVITFVIWAIYSTARWASNQPAVEKRGVLKWIFLVLLLVGLGSTLFNPASRSVQRGASERPQPQMHHQTVAEADERVVDTALSNSISFTITAVDLRLEKGQRWLAIQYVDDVRGDCERVFRTESHGFKFTARTTASIANPPGSPPVRAQRVEWLIPEGVSEAEAEAFRDAVAKSIREKSFVVAQGAERRLFNLPVGSVGNLSVVIGAIPKPASP